MPSSAPTAWPQRHGNRRHVSIPRSGLAIIGTATPSRLPPWSAMFQSLVRVCHHRHATAAECVTARSRVSIPRSGLAISAPTIGHASLYRASACFNPSFGLSHIGTQPAGVGSSACMTGFNPSFGLSHIGTRRRCRWHASASSQFQSLVRVKPYRHRCVRLHLATRQTIVSIPRSG